MSGSKGIKSAPLIRRNQALFRCPICSDPMELVQDKSLICSRRHCFDLARQGYVNLLPQSHKTKYRKELFVSRREIYRRGLYEPLLERIAGIIGDLAGEKKELRFLDAGCGEGYHLAGIMTRLPSHPLREVTGVGIDIAKEGVAIAAKEYPHLLWCVADLAKVPLADQTFDLILNILSPSNYSEFRRLLRDDGLVIKVIPESNYLRELRQILYAGRDKESYSNQKTEELFKDHLVPVDAQCIQYQVKVDEGLMAPLLQMTPLAWGATEEDRQKALTAGLEEITIDLTILCGKKSV